MLPEKPRTFAALSALLLFGLLALQPFLLAVALYLLVGLAALHAQDLAAHAAAELFVLLQSAQILFALRIEIVVFGSHDCNILLFNFYPRLRARFARAAEDGTACGAMS